MVKLPGGCSCRSCSMQLTNINKKIYLLKPPKTLYLRDVFHIHPIYFPFYGVLHQNSATMDDLNSSFS